MPQTSNCHPGRKHRAHGLCDNCYHKLRRREGKDSYSSLTPEQRRKRYQSGVRYKASHPERVRAWQRKQVLNNRSARLIREYGISLVEYDKMLVAQEGVCAICGRPDPKRRLTVDHCHLTGKVRGLLCKKCNTAIGLLGDSSDVLVKALAYCLKHKPPCLMS